MNQIPILVEPGQLQAFAERLAGRESIAVDLEADSMHHYREQVCLLQVTAGDETVLIDPLRLPDLEPLRTVLADPSVRKLFHAADYDLRCLRRDFGLEVRGLFDTMIASQFCGEEKFGLADLLGKYFGVELDKKYQKADWTIRPLPDGMVRYAAEDTRHLQKLAALLGDRLEGLGRTSWVAEECLLLEQVRFEESGGPLYLRFKGAGKLDRRQLAILDRLLVWRDREAARRDVPPFKVFGNQGLREIALHAPQDLRALAGLEGIFPRLVERYGRALMQCVEEARALPEEDLPRYPKGERQQRDPEFERRLAALKTWRTRRSGELQLDPGVMINNALLEQLARTMPERSHDLDRLTGMKNWQRRNFGGELLKVLAKA